MWNPERFAEKEMHMVRLQNILLPKTGVCAETEMFFRAEQSCLSKEEDCIQLKQNETVRFDTYFNSFSIEKWQKYTCVDEVTLNLSVKGRMEIDLYNLYFENGSVSSVSLYNTEFHSEQKETASVSFPNQAYKGIFCFSVKALDDNSRVYGGWYASKIAETDLNPVDLAIDI